MNGVLLGSGGWIPTSKRETCCAYLREGSHVLLIDAGTGVQRLLEQPDLLSGAETVDIVLTHFHLDHVVGLSYLPATVPARASEGLGPGSAADGCVHPLDLRAVAEPSALLGATSNNRQRRA